MLFVIHALDKPGSAPLRTAHYDAHKSFLSTAESYGVQIVMSGPLVADDGSTPIGSHFILEAPNRGAVEAFHKADPFFAADIWHPTSVNALMKRRG